MRTLTATELKTRTGDFFEALLVDGKVTVTRNGRTFRLIVENVAAKLAQFPSRDLPDILITATALVHDLTVVTRNVTHFEDTGVRIVNPWK